VAGAYFARGADPRGSSGGGGRPFLGIPPNELKYIAHIAFDGYTAFVKDERIPPNTTMRAIILCSGEFSRKNGPGQKLYSCSFLSPGAYGFPEDFNTARVCYFSHTIQFTQLNTTKIRVRRGGGALHYVYIMILCGGHYRYLYIIYNITFLQTLYYVGRQYYIVIIIIVLGNDLYSDIHPSFYDIMLTTFFQLCRTFVIDLFTLRTAQKYIVTLIIVIFI